MTIEDVFAAVQSGQAEHGVVPFENSSNGAVIFTLDLFADPVHKYQDVIVHGEVYVPVRHCLLGPAPTTSDISLSRITKLYSHPQAWGQCKKFLGEHFRGVERQDVSSTSRAAEIVASEGPTSTSAAVSSIMAATTTGLAVLAEGIEDISGNATRFLVLRRRAGAEDHSSISSTSGTRPVKSLVSFTLHQHGSPGALAECLDAFRQHALSLTSISTRPSGEASWHYIFLVEFLAARRQPASEESGQSDIAAALAALGKVAKAWRWIGSWDDELPNGTGAEKQG